MDQKDCPHNTLQFGSGDYYIFCMDCPKKWCCNPKGDGALDGQDWNVGTVIIGGRRVKEAS